jgi:NitT/TauT family transport system substrate-binding protein
MTSLGVAAHWRKRTVWALAAVTLAAGVSACSSSGGSGAKNGLTSVTVATPGPSSAFGFLWVAQDQGIFAKNGLSVKLVTVSNAAQVPGLVKGSFQAIPQAGTTERAALQGQPVVNVLSALTNATSAMVVRGGINSPEDLKGKTIATASAISTPTHLLNAYLKKHGLSDSVKVLSLQTESAQTTAFTAGRADGLFLNLDAVVEATGQLPGSHILVTPADLNLPAGAQAGLATSKSFLSSHPDTVRAMIRSAFEATKYSMTHPAETEAIYAKEFGATQDEAKYIYEQIKPYLVLRGSPSGQELANNAASDSNSIGKTVTVDDLKKAWDTSLAEEVFDELNCPDVCAKRADSGTPSHTG